MNKEKRQERHQLRLKLKKEHEGKMAGNQAYYWKFVDETMKELRELPERSHEHPFMASLLYLPSFKDQIHCRIEWNDDSAIRTTKTWKYETDSSHFTTMPQGPNDPRLPQDYWQDIKPTIEIEHKEMARDSVNELIRLVALMKLSIQPPIPEIVPDYLHEMAAFLKVPVRQLAAHSLYMDGHSFELTFAQGEAISIWKWHNEPPESWKELEKIVAVMMTLAKSNHQP